MDPVILGKRGRFIFYLALTALVAGVKLMAPAALDRIEWKFQDILYEFKGSTPVSKDVVIVNIDDLSIRELGGWPWKEEIVADLIAAVGTAEPRSVLIDFSMPNYSKGLTADSGGIADQLFWMKNVILSYDIVPSEQTKDTVTNPKFLFRNALITNSDLGKLAPEQALPVRTVSLPDSAVADAATRMGFTYSSVDADNTLRSEPLVMNYQGYYYPSTALAAASHFLRVLPEQIVVHGGSAIEIGERLIPTNTSGQMQMNFPAGTGFNIFSASDILNQRISFSEFAEKLVIVTLGAGAQSEYYKTPVANETPRYLLTAIATDNILRKNYLHRADSHVGWYLFALALIGFISAYSLQKISSLYRVAVVAVGLIALANVNYLLFNTFNLLANSIYVALLLILFLITSPLMSIDYSFLPFLRPKLVEDEEELETQRKRETRSAVASAIRTMPRRTAVTNQPALAANAGLNQTLSLDKTMALSGNADNSHTVALTSAIEASKERIQSDVDNKTMAIDSGEVNAPAPVSKSAASPAVIPPTASQSDSADKFVDATDETAMFGDLTSAVIDEPIGAESDVADKSAQAPLQGDDASLKRETVRHAEKPKAEALAEPPAVESKPEPKIIVADPQSALRSAGDIKTLGRYQIRGVLGKGAMGLVYDGIDPAINRRVALKTIRLDFLIDPDEMKEMKERLFLEAQAAGKLNHPNIVTIYDVGSEGTMQYIAMELIEGQTLEDLIKREVNFNFKIVARMIHQICQALQYAHDAGIVHRDIKPANLMVLPDYSIKVMDFGIARVESSSMTKTGVAMGTPNYISPEQLQGQKIDGRSDLFSLGIVFYEMLVGSRPFKGTNLTSLIYSIVNTEPEAPSRENPRIPPLFDHIVSKALKKKPEERYQRASDISAALSDFVQSFATR